MSKSHNASTTRFEEVLDRCIVGEREQMQVELLWNGGVLGRSKDSGTTYFYVA